jgi:hypothetical protein
MRPRRRNRPARDLAARPSVGPEFRSKYLCNATGGSSAADMVRFGGPRFPIGLVREDLPVVGVVDGLWQRLVVAWAARIGVRALVAFLPGDDQSAQPDTRCGDGGERMIRR